MSKGKLIKKIVAKQIFDEYTILSKEILNILSVALSLKAEGNVKALKDKALDYINEYKYIEIGKSSVETLKKSGLVKEVIDILAYNTENIEPLFRINYLFIDSKEVFLTSTEILIDTLLYLYKRCNIAKVILDIYMFPSNFDNLGKISEARKFNLFKKRKKLIGFSKTDELILLSFFFNDIENILNILNLVAKYLKFKRESSRQVYIPFPLLQRRYRIYNLQAFLNDELVKVINALIKNQSKIFKQNETLSFVLTSDYNIGDKVNEYGENTALIKGSFFWREMLRLFPIIMNVFAGKLLNILTPYKKQILKEIVEFLHSRIYKNIFIRDDIFFSKLELEKLTQDIFSDIISFLIFGDSYILSLVSSGVLGNKYYDTLGIKNKELDEKGKIKKLWIDFEYLYEDIMFNTDRESSLIRLKVLLDIREYIKNSKRYNSLELSLLDSQKPISIADEIKEYMNDLFPIWDKISVGDTYKRLSIYQKKSVKLIGNLINFISKVYVKRLKDFLKDIKYPSKEKFLGVYIDNSLFSEEKLYFYAKSFKVNVKKENIEEAFYKIELKNNYIDVSIIPNPAFFDFRRFSEVSLLAVVWKNLINKLTKKNKTLSYGIYEGSMLRSVVNIKKYNEFINNSVGFEYDYLNFLKTRSFFESFKDKQTTFGDVIKNYSYYAKEKKLKVFLLSDFTTLFLSKDMYGTDIWETKLYGDVIRNLGFLDRHSLLKIRTKKINYYKNWIVFILIKFSKKFRKFKRELRKSFYIDNEKRVFIKEIRELVEDFKIRDKFFGFSLGWEDLILYYEDNCLTNIFEFMEKLQDFTIIQRTETIIGFNMEKRTPLCVDTTRHDRNFHLYMFARLKHTNELGREIDEKFNNDNFIKRCNIFPEIYPGRFDMILSKKYLKEDEIINCLNEVLNTRAITLKLGRNKKFYIEDLVLKITSISDFYT